MELLSEPTLEALCQAYGLYAVFAFIALESMGVPLPGETILIVAGIYAGATRRIDILSVIGIAASAAIIGDNIGYLVGRSVGQASLRKYGRHIGLDERRIKIGQYLFLRQGGKIVFFGRFVAVLRAFAALLAGVGCYTFWGLVPLVFQLMHSLGASPFEIIGHRTFWSVFWAFGLVLAAGQWPQVRRIFTAPKVLAMLALTRVFSPASYGMAPGGEVPARA